MVVFYLTEVTSQFRATAARQIREPRKPLPPKTTIRFVADILYGGSCVFFLCDVCGTLDESIKPGNSLLNLGRWMSL